METKTFTEAVVFDHLRAISVGVLLAGLTLLLTVVVPESVALDFHAVLLGGIGAVYLGFALADGRWSMVVLESAGAAGFVLLAVLGLAWSVRFLVLGYFLHSAWDLVHHNRKIPAQFAGWYIPFCAVYDATVGAYLLFLL